MTEPIEPALIVESERIDDQFVSIPAAHRVSQPGRLGITRQNTAVDKHLSKRRVLLVQKDEPRIARSSMAAEKRRASALLPACRKTSADPCCCLRGAAETAQRPRVASEDLGCAPSGAHEELGRCAPAVTLAATRVALRSPDTRQVGLAVRGLGHGRAQIRPSIREPRRSIGWAPQPLSRNCSGQRDNEQGRPHPAIIRRPKPPSQALCRTVNISTYVLLVLPARIPLTQRIITYPIQSDGIRHRNRSRRRDSQHG